jgi:hypothetical protein
LRAGWYSVEVGAPQLGWAPMLTVCVDGNGLFDLGNVQLPSPGSVRLVVQGREQEPFTEPHVFFRRTAVCDVAEAAVGAGGVTRLAPGEHVVVWRQQQTVHAVAFQVTGGELVTVTMPAR